MRASEFLPETINPDILDPRFSHSQQIGDYTYTANYAGRGALNVRCSFRGQPVGRADFETTDDDPGSLTSAYSSVAPSHRRRGIASTMYAYAKMLGNDIKPSDYQLRRGIAMWDAWKKAGDDKHLVAEESYQPPELEVGDKILKGKFKNSPAEIKGFKKDKHNQPVLKTNKGDIQLFKPRVVKLMKESDFRPTTLKLGDHRGPYHPETMEPYPDNFKSAMDLHDVVDEMIENGIKPKVVNISPRHLLASQDWLSDHGSDEVVFPQYRDKPVVLDNHGELIILDGHHRCANALKNNKMVQVYLFDILT